MYLFKIKYFLHILISITVSAVLLFLVYLSKMKISLLLLFFLQLIFQNSFLKIVSRNKEKQQKNRKKQTSVTQQCYLISRKNLQSSSFVSQDVKTKQKNGTRRVNFICSCFFFSLKLTSILTKDNGMNEFDSKENRYFTSSVLTSSNSGFHTFFVDSIKKKAVKLI